MPIFKTEVFYRNGLHIEMNGLYFPRRKPEKRHTWNREKGEPGPEFHSTSFRIRITRSSAAVSARGMRGEAILPIGRRKSPAHSGAEGMICTGSHNRCSQKGITMLQRLTVILCLACFWFSIAPAADPAATAPRYQLSTHILDVSRGRPASGVPIQLFRLAEDEKGWNKVGEGITDDNGRIGTFLPESTENAGIYKLRFETRDYFRKQNQDSIYPFVEVVFEIRGTAHYHIPITMSANGYGTYRGN